MPKARAASAARTSPSPSSTRSRNPSTCASVSPPATDLRWARASTGVARPQQLLQRLEEPRAEIGARHQRRVIDLLVGGMRALAVGAQPVERRDAERGGEVAVAAAAGQRHVFQLLADLAVDCLRFLKQGRDAGVLLVRRPVHLAFDDELDILADRLE